MISICVPIYNFDVTLLVKDLQNQISKQKDHSIEIILIDDASDIFYRNLNSFLKNSTTYIQLEKNIGRASIRNLFLEYARNSFLIFLDCDGLLSHNTNFIENYLIAAQKNLDVVCGKRIYPELCPSPNVSLNWKYGTFVENSSIEINFMSNNFMIKKTLFDEISFDEELKNYGQEDTLFGIELEKKNVKITIINNPVLNGHLENNSEYLKKYNSSIKNLVELYLKKKIDKKNYKSIKLLNTFHQLNKLKLTSLYNIIYQTVRPLLRKNLLGPNPNLKLFNFYKLGEFISIKKELTK